MVDINTAIKLQINKKYLSMSNICQSPRNKSYEKNFHRLKKFVGPPKPTARNSY